MDKREPTFKRQEPPKPSPTPAGTQQELIALLKSTQEILAKFSEKVSFLNERIDRDAWEQKLKNLRMNVKQEQTRNARLKKLLDEHGISYSKEDLAEDTKGN